MKKTMSVQFLYLTFAITYVSWGILIISGLAGFYINEHFWLYPFFLLGGWSPTISSYIVLKKNNSISGISEWVRNVFDFRKTFLMYLMMLFFALIYFVPQMILSDITQTQPLYMLLLLTFLMLFAGGLEEAGWRGILQPELEKKFGYIKFCAIFSVIWLIWHLPLFFIPGSGQAAMNIPLYSIGIMGLSFSMGALMKMTNSVFLCVILHCLVNAGRNVFVFKDTLPGAVISMLLLVIASVILVRINERSKNKEYREGR